MTIMAGSLYRALKEAGVSEDLASKAAEEVATYDERFAKIDADLLLLKWMVGVIIAGVISLIIKAYFP